MEKIVKFIIPFYTKSRSRVELRRLVDLTIDIFLSKIKPKSDLNLNQIINKIGSECTDETECHVFLED